MFKKTGKDQFAFNARGLRATAGYAQAPVTANDRINRAIAERLRLAKSQAQAEPQSDVTNPFTPDPIPAHVGEG